MEKKILVQQNVIEGQITQVFQMPLSQSDLK